MLRKCRETNDLSTRRLPTRSRAGLGAGSLYARPQLETLEPRWLLSLADSSSAATPIGLKPILPTSAATAQTDHLVPEIATSESARSTDSDLSQAGFNGLVPLPISDNVTLDGSIDPRVGARLYKITLEANTTSLQIEMHTPDPSKPLDRSIDILDESGRTMAGVIAPSNTNSVSINVKVGDVPTHTKTGHSVYLKVGSAHTSTLPIEGESGSSTLNHGVFAGVGTSTSSPFVLSVTRQSSMTVKVGVDKTLDAPSTAPSALQLSPGSGADSEPPRIAPAVTTSAASLNPSNTSKILLPGLVATGPLPSRTGLPGRALSDEPASNERSNGAPVIDLALMDLPRSPQPDTLNFDEPVLDGTESQGSPEGPLVSLRGPGGLPLFGSSIEITGPIARPMVSFAQTPRIQSPAPVAPLPAASTEIVPTKRTGTAAKVDPPNSAEQAPRLSGLVILGVTLTSGLCLPSVTDPIRKRSGWRSVLRHFRLRTK